MPKLGELLTAFLSHLAGEVAAKRRASATLDYYRHELCRLVDLVGADREVVELIPWDLLKHGPLTWHRAQVWQRLFNWGQSVGMLTTHPFARLERPPLGQRSRVLSKEEFERLLSSSRRPLRELLELAMHTIARPGELRRLDWSQWQRDVSAFLLTRFKAMDRRRDGVRVRAIVLNAPARELVAKLWKRQGEPAIGAVLLNGKGEPWTNNALRCAVRRARKRAGLDVAGSERVVAYTVRHTAATRATVAGVRDRTLADLMGHTNTHMTARYQHLDVNHLREAAEKLAG